MNRHREVSHQEISDLGLHLYYSAFHSDEHNQFGHFFVMCPQTVGITIIKDALCNYCGAKLK